MAHHRNTPDSVLSAPTSSPIVVRANKGMSREQRRARGNRQRASQNTPFVGKVRDALAALTPRTRDARGYYAMPSAVDLKERV